MLTTPFTSPSSCHGERLSVLEFLHGTFGASGTSSTGFFYSHSSPLTLSSCGNYISKHSRYFYKIEMLKSHHRLTDVRSAWKKLVGVGRGSSFLASSLEKLSWVCSQTAQQPFRLVSETTATNALN